MKLITPDVLCTLDSELMHVTFERFGLATSFPRPDLEIILEVMARYVVTRCIQTLNNHHDDLIDGHAKDEHFKVLEETLIEVKQTLRDLITDEGENHENL